MGILNREKKQNYNKAISLDRNLINICAALSIDVYEEPDRPPLPYGWVKFASDKIGQHGYHGNVYIDNAKKPTTIIWANRGTILNTGSILSDIAIFCEMVPDQLYSCIEFANSVDQALTEKFGFLDKNTLFVATGHSLGGALSDLLCLCLPFDINITFENPGTKNILKKILHLMHPEWEPRKLKEVLRECKITLKNMSTNYVADMNVINCCNKQVGNTFAVYPLEYNYQDWQKQQPPALEEIASNVYGNLHYLIDYTVNQHSIQKLFDKLNHEGSLIPVSYATGLQAAYTAYLDYNLRKAYWDGYVEFYWQENYDGVETDFSGDFLAFKRQFLLQLKISHANSKLENINEFNYKKSNLVENSIFNRSPSQIIRTKNDFVLIEWNEELSQEYKAVEAPKKCQIM